MVEHYTHEAYFSVSNYTGSGGFLSLEDQAELRFYEDETNGVNYTSFKAPAALTATTDFVWPDGDGNADEVLKTDGAGTLSWALGGGGGGSKNYFTADNTTFENSVGDWTTNGAGITHALTAVAGELLAGVNSLKITKDAADRSSSYSKCIADKTIDEIDRGGMLYGSIAFRPGTGYTSNDYILEVYDVTNSAVLYAGEAESLEIPNIKGVFDFNVQLEDSTASVELRLKVNNTDTNSTIVFIDEVKLGPSGQAVGYIATPAIDFTPVFTNFTLGNGTVDIASYRRVGNKMEGEVHVTLGSTSVMGSANMTIPGGEQLDSSAISISPSTKLGYGHIVDGGATYWNLSLAAKASSPTKLDIFHWRATANASSVTATLPMTWATGDTFQFNFNIPIDGWDTSSVMNTNQLHLQTASTSTTGVAPTGTIGASYNVAVFGTVNKDPHGLYNTSTGDWVAPKPGIVFVGAGLKINYTSGAAKSTYVRIENTTTSEEVTGPLYDPGTTASQTPRIFGVLEVSKGDVLQIQSWCNGTTPVFGAADQFFNITYIQDYSVLGVVKTENNLIEEAVTTGTAWPTGASQWVDLDQVELTPGTYDITLSVYLNSTGATTTSTVFAGLSTASGNSFPDGADGDTYVGVDKRTGSTTRDNLHHNVFDLVVLSTTTYYVKGFANASITNLTYTSRVSARKIT